MFYNDLFIFLKQDNQENTEYKDYEIIKGYQYAKYNEIQHYMIYIACYYCCLFAKLSLTLCDPMDCNPPGSSLHGISQARMEWVALSSARGSSWSKIQTHIMYLALQVDFLPLSHLGTDYPSVKHIMRAHIFFYLSITLLIFISTLHSVLQSDYV